MTVQDSCILHSSWTQDDWIWSAQAGIQTHGNCILIVLDLDTASSQVLIHEDHDPSLVVVLYLV